MTDDQWGCRRFHFIPETGLNFMRPCGNCRERPTSHMIAEVGKIAPYVRTCDDEECAAAGIALLAAELDR